MFVIDAACAIQGSIGQKHIASATGAGQPLLVEAKRIWHWGNGRHQSESLIEKRRQILIAWLGH